MTVVHECNQVDKFTKIELMVNEVKCDLDEHRGAQQRQDVEREKHRLAQKEHDAQLDLKLADISTQIKELLELNKEVKDFKTAWKVGKSLGLGLAVVIGTLGIIFGGVIAVKEWIKH